MDESGWTAGQLTNAIRALGMQQGLDLAYDRTAVGHWMAGSKPPAPVPRLVAAAFERKLGRVVTPEQTGLTLWDPDLSRPGTPSVPGPVDFAAEVHRVGMAEVQGSPGGAGTARAYSLRGLPGPWPASTIIAPPDENSAERESVLRVASMVEIFGALPERFGGAHARTSVAAYLTWDVAPLLRSVRHTGHRVEMLRLTAQLTHVLASMSRDSGRHGAAQHHLHVALQLAHLAGDRALGAILLRSMGTHALQLGQVVASVRLSDAAVEVAGADASPAVFSYVLAGRAEAHAAGRQRTAALADLARAEAYHERSVDLVSAGQFHRYSQGSLAYQRAKVLAALCDHDTAIRALEESILTRPADLRWSVALSRAEMGMLLLAEHRLDDACEQWRAFLADYHTLRSERARFALADIRRALGPFRRSAPALRLLRHIEEITRDGT
ncbi:hypothetical protein ACN20G_28615 (plasmid) [Streptomyces sp. BI20]|uniref:hypothetical protein n=1 Tax=Streptomyces sp. BI20 TaxID=3403460 RepID=UPI003C762D92